MGLEYYSSSRALGVVTVQIPHRPPAVFKARWINKLAAIRPLSANSTRSIRLCLLINRCSESHGQCHEEQNSGFLDHDARIKPYDAHCCRSGSVY
jgi:hypothetical protein